VADPRALLETALADRYRVERELGRGGMATVYLAQDLRHDRPVALKVLRPELAATLGPERFQREIRFAARLQHPHILTVLDSGEASGQLWFTMPYVDGETLRARIRREGQLSLTDALRIAREAAAALDYAHRHGVIHRDIKPENILLTHDADTLVADFGIARALAGPAGDPTDVGGPGPLTETGMSLGTPAYMSPEQASGERDIDARSDVYSLGCVLYEMLAGEPPFTGPTTQSILLRKFTETPRLLRAVRDTVPEAVERAVAKALARAPADRFRSAAELSRALELAPVAGATGASVTPASGAPASAAPTVATAAAPAHRPSLARRYAITLALLGGFAIGLGVLFAWRRGHGGSDVEAGGTKRLAVLPFENLGDSASEYFADGITDEVRGKLSALPGLQVIASRSSSEYKHTPKRLPDIARELGVDYVLIGKVRWEKSGSSTSRVRVSPELVAVSSGVATTKWQQPFDASLTDVFQVQADIAGRVADALNLALGSTQRETLKEKPTTNLAAYDAFLKGEAASQSLAIFDGSSLRLAISYYEQAIALDSTFLQAWVQLARANSLYLATASPGPTAAEGAKRAADRAMQLGPGRPESRLALGSYYANVRSDPAAALAEFESGLRTAPDNADLLTASALAEESLGRWEAALEHFKRAQALDPRSVLAARRLAGAYVWLRRYPEGVAAADRALALSPTNLSVIQTRAMASLVQGDLAGARAVINAVPPEVEPTALAVFFGVYADLGWVLTDDQQELLLRLPPSAFDNDRANWGIVRAQVYALRGDLKNQRIYADSARLGFVEHIQSTPDDAQQHALYGLALAYVGRKAEAIREGLRGVELLPISRDGFAGPYMQHQLVRIYILVGEPEKALDALEPLLKIPYSLSPGMLRVDPNFTPLRKNPRFQALVSQQ